MHEKIHCWVATEQRNKGNVRELQQSGKIGKKPGNTKKAQKARPFF